jgi:(p)ppGpp synthase/HD superfamily hydrolase
MHDEVKAARQFALEWHGGQMWDDLPYIEHLDRVAALLTSLGAETWQIVAAYLHDILEDTACPESLIEQKFGTKVLAWVKAVSGNGANRKEKQADIVRKLQADTTGATLLKLGDRLVNVRKCVEDQDEKLLKMYRKDVPLYAELFAKASPVLNAELNRLLAVPV